MELHTLDALFDKMSEYTKMETELPFAEFQEYDQALIDYLMQNYNDMNVEELVKAMGMTMIVAGNAKMRAQHKDQNRKKFVKMGEKAKLWEDAIALKLKKGGMTADDLDERVAALWE